MKWCEKKTILSILYVSFHSEIFMFTWCNFQHKIGTSEGTIQEITVYVWFYIAEIRVAGLLRAINVYTERLGYKQALLFRTGWILFLWQKSVRRGIDQHYHGRKITGTANQIAQPQSKRKISRNCHCLKSSIQKRRKHYFEKKNRDVERHINSLWEILDKLYGFKVEAQELKIHNGHNIEDISAWTFDWLFRKHSQWDKRERTSYKSRGRKNVSSE